MRERRPEMAPHHGEFPFFAFSYATNARGDTADMTQPNTRHCCRQLSFTRRLTPDVGDAPRIGAVLRCVGALGHRPAWEG